MKIQWIGHAAFLIETSDGRKLITDPYDSGSYDGAVGYEEIDIAADVVTVSHNHPDHDGVENMLVPPTKVIRTPEPVEAESFIISGMNSFHDENKGEDRGSNIIYVIEAEGIRICHLGDLGHLLSDDEVLKLGQIDVLLIPVGGHFTIDAVQATELIEKIKPAIVVPMHYKTSVLGFPIAGVDDFLKGKSNVVIEDSTYIDINVDSLPEETQVRVLKHAK